MLLQALRNSEAHRIHLKAKNQVIFFEKKVSLNTLNLLRRHYRITCDVIIIKEKRTTRHFFSAEAGLYGANIEICKMKISVSKNVYLKNI